MRLILGLKGGGMADAEPGLEENLAEFY